MENGHYSGRSLYEVLSLLEKQGTRVLSKNRLSVDIKNFRGREGIREVRA